MDWNFVGSCSGDNYIIDGIDIFKEKWENTGETVQVTDPLYGQKFTFNLYRVKKGDKTISFVTGEFSNCVFGIYLKRNKNK